VNGYITWYYNLANGVEDLISASMEQDKVIVSVLTISSVGPKIVQFFISSIDPDGSITRTPLTPTPTTTNVVKWLGDRLVFAGSSFDGKDFSVSSYNISGYGRGILQQILALLRYQEPLQSKITN
jgi:hypothetical protein